MLDEEQIKLWNECHPVGCRILAWPGAREGAPYHTYLRNPASDWSPNPSMAYVVAYGNIALSHLELATGDPAEHDRLHREELVARYTRVSMVENKLKAQLRLHADDILKEMAFFHSLSQDDFDSASWKIIEASMWRTVIDLASREIDNLTTSYTKNWPAPGVKRPAVLDHRQRLKVLYYPAELPRVRKELNLWLNGDPLRQPFKPELVAEEPKNEYGSIWVTLALPNLSIAFGLGRNLPRNEKGAVMHE